ncbi:aminoglycoside 6-adenylyltransferase [Bacillus sp. T33-2]|uniref:aminoglycoside 6-adenylyltransferase n=1 Tax=Bacillus sp. T33-2 TaxID=2054168 RepID=UPI0015E07F30|nr:aminoglycoside 6-adenylyltransferase [Bacillus sp. T33-2]
MEYENLVDNFLSWAKTEEAVQAAIMIGSRARTDVPADRWSDLDILLITDTPGLLLDSEEWLGHIGAYSITFLEKTAVGGSLERRVLFEPDLDVDFAVFTHEHFTNMLSLDEVKLVFKRGYKVLIDKIHIHKRIEVIDFAKENQSSVQPAAQQYDNVVQDFYYHAVWTMKKMLRGELWVAKDCLDDNMKSLLLQMIEWHAKAVNQTEPWHNGRFIEKWADPRAVQAFIHLFATYEKEDMHRALLKSMKLFALLARETGAHLGCAYPFKAENKAFNFVEIHYSQLL